MTGLVLRLCLTPIDGVVIELDEDENQIAVVFQVCPQDFREFKPSDIDVTPVNLPLYLVQQGGGQ